jgi:hypothetical protein
MGRMIEKPIRDLFCRGLSGLAEHLTSRGPLLIFVWLSLVFLKTHLKDRTLKLARDLGISGEAISQDYDWARLHYVHCIARSFFTGCSVDGEAIGSMLFLAAKSSPDFEMFDFRDVHYARSILIRFDDFAILSVLDDGCGSFSVFQKVVEKLTGAMSPIQLRETLGHLSYINMHLRERARFWTEFDPIEGLTIVGETPLQAEVDGLNTPSLGEVVFGCCEDMLSHFQNPNIEEIKKLLRDGRWSFLWDASGNFDSSSMDRLK